MPEDEKGKALVKELIDKLESVIVPFFYEDKAMWAAIMENCIGLNRSFFQSNRMLQQYVLNSYLQRS